MITVLLIMLYVGGIMGVVKSAPEEHNPAHVLLSGLLWPIVIFSVLVEKFMRNKWGWEDGLGVPKVKTKTKK